MGIIFEKLFPYTAYNLRRNRLLKAENLVFDLAFENAGRGGEHYRAVVDAVTALRDLRLNHYQRKTYEEFEAGRAASLLRSDGMSASNDRP